MSTLTRSALHVEVRRIFLEEVASGTTTDFIDISQIPDEVDDNYDKACAEQHQIIVDNAQATGRLEDHDNAYLQRYLSRKDYTLVRGQSEYEPVPGDLFRMVKFTVGGMRGTRITPVADRLVRTWPDEYGPGKGEFMWVLLSAGIQSPPDADDRTRTFRVYVYGDRIQTGDGLQRVGVPLVAQDARAVYYRYVRPIAYQCPVVTVTDVEEPFNEGPIHGCVGRLFEKAQNTERATYHRSVALAAANRIMPAPPPPQAG